MDDLSRFCCLNSGCPEHGKRGGGNLTVSHRYGPGRSKRMLRCRACKARFSQRKGTALLGSHLPPEKALSVLQHIAEGNGVRKTGRLVGVHRETVARYGRMAGPHAAGLHDELVAIFPLAPMRSSSTRSGPSSPRRRPAATRASRPTSTRGTIGTTSPWTPTIGWSSAS